MPASAVEYLLPAEFELASVAAQLPFPLHVDGEQIQSGRRVVYDTFDGRLRSNGLRLLHEDGMLKLVGEDGRELGGLPTVDAPETLRPAELEPGVLRERLSLVCDVRALLRMARIDADRRLLPVLDDEEKTVARLVAERAVLSDGPRAGDALRPRLHLLGIRGYDKELARIRTVLEDKLGLPVSTETLEDELRARAESSPAGLSSEADVKLTPDLPADRAAVALSMRLLHVMEANLPGTLADIDSEFLHDFRVAVRRTRSLQRELKRVFPPEELERFREEFRWLQQVTGPSRDLDVYLLDFDGFAAAVPEAHRPDLELVRGLLEQRQHTERERMENDLRSDRTTALLRDWAEFLEQLPSFPVDDRPHAAKPIGEVAARRIDRVYGQMVGMGQAITGDSPHEDLHDLRKKGKELRYLLEFFSPLFPGKVTKPMVKTLKALQDTLGRFQDREIQADMLRGLGTEVAQQPEGAEALMAMGVLVERLNQQQDAARAEFNERFAAFSSREQRELVKSTFR